jgi:hypothetical protein
MAVGPQELPKEQICRALFQLEVLQLAGDPDCGGVYFLNNPLPSERVPPRSLDFSRNNPNRDERDQHRYTDPEHAKKN